MFCCLFIVEKSYFKYKFLSPKCANIPISYTNTLYHLLPTFTSFYQLLYYFYQLLPCFIYFYYILPSFSNFYTTFTSLCYLPSTFAYFYHPLPTFLTSVNFYYFFVIFHQLLPTSINFYTTFHQSKMVIFFFLLLTCTNCWMSCYRH